MAEKKKIRLAFRTAVSNGIAFAAPRAASLGKADRAAMVMQRFTLDSPMALLRIFDRHEANAMA